MRVLGSCWGAWVEIPGVLPCPVLGETPAHLQSRSVSVKINPAWVSDTSDSTVGHTHRFQILLWEGGDSGSK